MTNLNHQPTTPSLTTLDSVGFTRAVNEADVSYSNDDQCLTEKYFCYEELPGTSLVFVPLAYCRARYTPKYASDDTPHYICIGCENRR